MAPVFAVELDHATLGVITGADHIQPRQSRLDLKRLGLAAGQGARLHVHPVAGHGDIVGGLQDAGQRTVQRVAEQVRGQGRVDDDGLDQYGAAID